ncbi:uncharacterized protein LOC109711035 [Ananas comosus]|uniref:Uncharacterized protein LOC109711035 n=1 Tax=Ananas comosus TaxID=4615 RepID=A0A6P5F116_ANACO|nr:uncharacterized protein LOC109711035 [Ananas comosus]
MPPRGRPKLPRGQPRTRSMAEGPSGVGPAPREQIQRLQEALERQQTTAAQAGVEPPAPPVVVPTVAEGVAATATPVAAVPVTAIAAGSGTSNPDSAAIEAKRERALEALVLFKKFNPPIFDGEKIDAAVVEAWVDSMETLFEDIYSLEKDKVPLATHCLEKAAKVWWKRVKWDRSSDLAPILWEEFRRALFANYFPDTEKRKLQEKFRKLKQGDQSVGEYEREFSHIIDYVPDVVRDDRDRANWFVHGLRPGIHRAVQILKLPTFAEAFDRALWAEQGYAHEHKEREAAAEAKDKSKKWAAGGTGGRPSAKKPHRYPRPQSKGWRPSRCVICGGNHQPPACPQREGKCFKCGQGGT